MYKDKEVQRKAVSDAVKKHRKGITKGITSQGITSKTGGNAVIPDGVTLFWHRDGKKVELKEVPEGCRVLSDGQCWLPRYPVVEPVKQETFHPPIMKYLIPGLNRDRMVKVVESLKDHKQLGNVYLGVGKNSIPMDMIGELLECTG